MAVLACTAVAGGLVPGASAAPAETGVFSKAFTEPTINGKATKEDCVPHDHAPNAHPPEAHGDKEFDCKPAAASMAILPNGKSIYFNGIEGSEDVDLGIAGEIGQAGGNDQIRLLDVRGARPKWSLTSPDRAGANPNGYEIEPVAPGLATTETYNDGAVFCADLNYLADGRLMVVGGTAYYAEPGVDGMQFGLAELEGLRSTRFYDYRTNRWTQGDDMDFGRWYPTLVTLGDGKTFVASGVQKLIKPVYPTHPTDSGRNVTQTETFDPKTRKWTYNGESADRSLPLFPRLHLLPNGHVYYNAAGQVFNPAGQAYDEVLWNVAATYDPKTKTWTDAGVPGIGTMAPGFRGSSFSIMLPLTPNDGYSKASFLSAGGVMGVTPGSYIANPFSAITTIDTKDDNAAVTEATGSLNLTRWYSTGVALPSGEVVIFNGANRDEVVGPGSGNAMQQAELFDPATKTWKAIATSGRARTYHNTAALLPDGRVLVGGHAPINTMYANHTTLPGGFSPNNGKDPSFEIFSPPYLFRGARPKINGIAGPVSYGKRFTITTNVPASKIGSVTLVRNTSITHLTDGDQRVVELKVVSRSGNNLTVAMAPNGNVVPAGPYMLFVNAKSSKGSIPSVARQLFVR
ncbi:MAG: galactose oxidase-like domain-containing protein [Actinomycetota bacterium]